MNSFLVKSISDPLALSNSHDVGRYREIVPLEGHNVKPGTIAEFFGKDGKRIKGKVEPHEDWSALKVQLIDCFATK